MIGANATNMLNGIAAADFSGENYTNIAGFSIE
jgi:hypothetical protein